MWCHRPVVCCYLRRRWGLLHCREKSHQPSWSCVQVFAVEICSVFLRGFNTFYSTEWKHLCSPTSAVPSILLSFKWCLMLHKSEDYFLWALRRKIEPITEFFKAPRWAKHEQRLTWESWTNPLMNMKHLPHPVTSSSSRSVSQSQVLAL